MLKRWNHLQKYLRDVMWWMSIKKTYKPGVPIVAKLSKNGASP
jgi:hypothetical protein